MAGQFPPPLQTNSSSGSVRSISRAILIIRLERVCANPCVQFAVVILLVDRVGTTMRLNP